MAASKRRRSAHDSSLFDYRNLEPRHLLSVSLPGGVNLVSNSTLTPLAESDTNLYSNEEVEGWNAVNAEAGQQLHLLKFSHDREFVLNLDATAGHFDQVFQDLATREGIEYTLAFDLRERPVAVDAAESTNDVEVLWNDESLGTFRGTQQWQTVALTVTGRADMSRLVFREVGQDEQDLGDGRGPLIDNVIATRMHTGFVANGSFELVADKSGELHHQSTVDGWQAMGSYDDRVMKIVQSAEATEGAGVLALDSSAERLDRLYQDLATEPDRQYYLSFDIKGADEPGMDNGLRIRWNGQWAGTFVGTSDWQTYGLLLEADSELTRLVLRETAGGEMGKGDGHGPLLDNIRIDKVDQLPQIPLIADAVITQGNDFYLDIAASDPDGTPLTYSMLLAGEPVSGNSVRPTLSRTGDIFWKPELDGELDLTVTVTGDFGVSVTQDFSLTVERNADVPPDFEPFSGQRQLSNVTPELRNGLYDQAPEMSIDTDKEYEAIFHTSDGQIRVLLNDDQAPITVNNFVNLALDGYYDGLTFHRVVDLGPGFIAQGGDPTGFGAGGPGYQFADEATALGEFDRRDLLAMANSGADTNGSQFFFTLSPQTHLNGQHAIFGEVIEGSDVVDAINRRAVGSTTPAEQIYSVSILVNDQPSSQWDFSVNLFKRDTNSSKQPWKLSNPQTQIGDGSSPFSVAKGKTFQLDNFVDPLHKVWGYGSKEYEKFLYVEHFGFAVNASAEDLSNYVLMFEFNVRTSQSYAVNNPYLAIYEDAIPATAVTSSGKTPYALAWFDLGDQRIQNALNRPNSQNKNNLKQFTFVPYDQTVAENDGQVVEYFGKRAAVVSFGSAEYQADGLDGIARNVSANQVTWRVNASELKTKSNLGWSETLPGKDLTNYGMPGWYVRIGAIADKLLCMDSPDPSNTGPASTAGLYHLVVDGIVQTEKGKNLEEPKILSQSILVYYDGKLPKYSDYQNKFTPILLQNGRQWAVTGTSDARIDATNRQTRRPNVLDPNAKILETYDSIKFDNLMLDLQSSYRSGEFGNEQGKIIPKSGQIPNNRSIAVAGVAFNANPTRFQSGIQLNSYSESYDWYVPMDSKNFLPTYFARIVTAINNHINQTPNTSFLNSQSKTVAPVWMFDNQMFTFSDGSDGPEVLSPHSWFECNYQMTPDDNLKVLSSHSTWRNMTLIQGNTGSAVSFGSYGFTNGPVTENDLGNVSVSRICQAEYFDGINGVIANKSNFGKPLAGYPDSTKEGAGMYNNTIARVDVDQWKWGNLVQNKIQRSGVFSALNWNRTFNALQNFTETKNPPAGKSTSGGFETADYSYTLAGGNDFGTLHIPQSVFANYIANTPKENLTYQNGLLFAFGGDNEGQNPFKIYYSGDPFTGSYGNFKDSALPYFKNNQDHSIGIKYPWVYEEKDGTISLPNSTWTTAVRNNIYLGIGNTITYEFPDE